MRKLLLFFALAISFLVVNAQQSGEIPRMSVQEKVTLSGVPLQLDSIYLSFRISVYDSTASVGFYYYLNQTDYNSGKNLKYKFLEIPYSKNYLYKPTMLEIVQEIKADLLLLNPTWREKQLIIIE